MQWIKEVVQWIEDHGTTTDILYKIIISMVGFVGAGLLYYFKFYRKQRSAALFGFYIRFDMLLSTLLKQIKSVSKDCNPFIILYEESTRQLLSLSFIEGKKEKTVENFLPVSQELKKLFLNTENNVYPKACKKESWYKSQKKVLEFVFMITDDLGAGRIKIDPAKIKRDNGAITRPKEAMTHIHKWTALENAVNDLLTILKEVKY